MVLGLKPEDFETSFARITPLLPGRSIQSLGVDRSELVLKSSCNVLLGHWQLTLDSWVEFLAENNFENS